MEGVRDRNPLEAASYRFGGFALDPARGILLRPDGAEVGLRPKSAEVLRHLARNPGRVVSRDELMEAVWLGVIVTDDSITQCVAEIRRVLSDEGAPLLRTLPKRGYLLAAEVTRGEPLPLPAAASLALATTAVVATSPIPAPGPGGALTPAMRPWRASLAAGGAVAAVALVGVAGWWGLHSRAPRPATSLAAPSNAAPTAPAAEAAMGAAPVRRLSMVVLPFANRDGDPEQEHLADGITQELTATFGRASGFLVIGRGAASTYKGRAVDVRQVGRELGVRYALDGSVRRHGEQVSVEVQLHDTANGALLWSDRFDLPRGDPAKLPGLVNARVRRPLGYEITTTEGNRSLAERPNDPDALDFTLRGYAIWSRGGSREGNLEARRLFERAVALDDGMAEAHVALGGTYIDAVDLDWSSDRDGDLTAGERHLARVIAINPQHSLVHYWRGVLHSLRWRFDEALIELDLVIANNRNAARAYGKRGLVMVLTDRPAQAVAEINEAMRISPHDLNFGSWFRVLGHASLMLGHDEEALGHYMRALAALPTGFGHQISLISAYGLLGRAEEAQSLLRDLRARRPELTVSDLRRRWSVWSPYPLYNHMLDRRAEGLRLAGLPEE
jgi:adenylate cyclase